MAAQRPSSFACLTRRMPHSRRQLLAKAAITASRGGISLSFQLDLAFDLVRQADAAERNRARGREFLVALELALRQGLADGLLDLALRAYPQHLEKFANAAVKDVFVHDRLLCWPLTTARRPLSDQATRKRRVSSMTRSHAQAATPDYAILLREALRADCRPFRTNSNVEPGKSLRSAESTQPKRALGWPPTS